MDGTFKALTKYSRLIFLLAVITGTASAYLEQVGYHPSMTYFTDLCLILCALGLAFWPRK